MPVLDEMRVSLVMPMELLADDELDAQRQAAKWERMGYIAYPVSLLENGGWAWYCRVEGLVQRVDDD